MNEDKYILITGTSKGLGQKMTAMLLGQGYSVIGLSRSGTDINDENFIDIVCDINDEESVEEMYDIISNHTDSLAAIVLNAGLFQIAPINETSSKEFLDIFKTNTLGSFHILKHAERFLKDNTHIITISSLAAKSGLSNMAAYSASKYALNGMIESIREEWKHLDVRFSTLLPGAINTTLWDNVEGEFPVEQMLSQEDFLHVFSMVINSPKNIQFPELIFLHRDGIYK